MIRSFEFERYSTTGLFTKFHALSKIIFLTIVTFTMILLDQTEILLFLNIIILILFLFSGLSSRLVVIGLGITIFTIYSLVFSQALFYDLQPRTLFFSFGQFDLGLFNIDLNLWHEGIFYGLKSSLRISAPFLLSYLIFFTTSPHEILDGLKRIGLNEGFSIMLLTALRFIPFIFENYQIIRASEGLKGYQFKILSPYRSIKTEIKLLIPVFFTAIRNARLVSISMIGRQVNLDRKQKKKFTILALRDKSLIVASISFFIFILMFKSFYWLYLYGIYYSENLRMVYAFTRTFL